MGFISFKIVPLRNNMVSLVKARGLRMTAQKQETLLKLTVLSLAAILCKFISVYIFTPYTLIFLHRHRKTLIVLTKLFTYTYTLFFAAFATRLFSVLRFESVIHEFDPYFNYRTTKYLAENGFYSFHNWFDDRVWYPLGRIIGGILIDILIKFDIIFLLEEKLVNLKINIYFVGTIYPGLMITSATLYYLSWLLNITLNIRNICVFLAPLFSSLTTIITYLLTKELKV